MRGKILSDSEYQVRKMKIMDDLSQRLIPELPENFLGNIVPILDSKILNKDEVQKIRDIVFSKPAWPSEVEAVLSKAQEEEEEKRNADERLKRIRERRRW